MWQAAQTAAPTSVAPWLTGPRSRQATGSPEVIGHPSTSPSHGDIGSLRVTTALRPVLGLPGARGIGIHPVG
jgi:hypothetical protein